MYQSNAAQNTAIEQQPELNTIVEQMRARLESLEICSSEIFESINRIKNIRVPQKESNQVQTPNSTVVDFLNSFNSRLDAIHTCLSESRNGLRGLVGQ